MTDGTASKPSPSSKSARRMAARLAAVQALYDIELTQHRVNDVIGAFTERGGTATLEGEDIPADPQLFSDIVRGVAANRADLDDMVAGAGRAREDVGRYEAVMRAVLRAGAFELWQHPRFDAPLLISQYLAVADSFYEGAEVKLVNAVLDALAKRLRGAAPAAEDLPDPLAEPADRSASD